MIHSPAPNKKGTASAVPSRLKRLCKLRLVDLDDYAVEAYCFGTASGRALYELTTMLEIVAERIRICLSQNRPKLRITSKILGEVIAVFIAKSSHQGVPTLAANLAISIAAPSIQAIVTAHTSTSKIPAEFGSAWTAEAAVLAAAQAL